MRSTAAHRVQALLLSAVLLVGGSGASVLDLALYHLGGHIEAPASPRVAGSDAPRTHGDTCVLLDWTAREPYTLAVDVLPRALARPQETRTPAPPADVRRSVERSATSRPRAPPSQLI
jgi:hypothetical protein